MLFSLFIRLEILEEIGLLSVVIRIVCLILILVVGRLV